MTTLTGPGLADALDALLAAPTWPETFAVLRARAPLLVSASAQREVERRVAQASGADATLLRSHLRLIAAARARGVEQACAAILRGVRQARRAEITRVLGPDIREEEAQ